MASSDSTLTPEQIREVLDYDPITGRFTWKPREGDEHTYFNEAHAGKEAGHKRTKESESKRITIRKQRYYANRLAWILETGADINPKTHVLYHRNGDLEDTSFDNLELLTKAEFAGRRAEPQA